MRRHSKASSSRSKRAQRKRFAITSLLAAVIVLALPAAASADPLGEITTFSAGLNAGASPLSSVTQGPDGNVWFTDGGETKAIGKVTPSGTITEYTAGLAAGANPVSITAGPDGNLWFTDAGTTPAIGKITPSGTITEYPLEEEGRPVSITAGPDGNLWYTDTKNLVIGKVNTSGVVLAEYSGLNEFSKPASIISGPGGNLWFADQGSTKAIGKITTSGTITEYPVSGNPGINGIDMPVLAAGPDGNLWFPIEEQGIGRITPTGTVTLFTAGLQAAVYPASITTGSDGNLWFTNLGEFGGGENTIASITTSGTITEYPAGGLPFSIGSGPGGNVWFVEPFTPSVGKFGIEAGPSGSELTVTKEGTGAGTVVSSPAGIECGGTCTAEFTTNAKVTLTASPSAGSLFVSWKGCEKGGVNGRQCTVTMDKAKTVNAKFITAYDVTVNRVGSGLGKVSSSPGGVLCLSNCASTSAAFKEGTSVTLSAAPTKNYVFTEWTGDCSGSGPCSLGSLGADKTVGAKFTAVAQHNLTVTKSGGGQGTAKSNLAGINCGATCSSMAAAYFQGAVVELTATPGKGSAFGGWSGGGCSGTGTCTVTMSAAKSVTAEFK